MSKPRDEEETREAEKSTKSHSDACECQSYTFLISSAISMPQA